MTDSVFSRRQILQHTAALGVGGLLTTAPSWAADWPSKPIRLVVPFNAGGATDLIARAVGEALSKRINQPVLVDNKGGAAGILGTDNVVKAAPDGHTLLLSLSTSMLINQFLYKKLPYNPQKDLALVTQIAAAPVTLVVHPSVPANNMQELLAYVKANKGKLSYGSWGPGSYAHLAGAYMSKTQDADMIHSPYKGEAPMLQDLIGGQLHLCFASALGTRAMIESGRLKPIGVTGTQRMQILPNLPTIYEQGVQDEAYAIFGWVALGAPAKTPQAIVDALHGHLQAVAQDPVLLERIASAGFMPLINTPQQFRANYEKDMPVWKALVEQAGAQLD